MVNLRILKNRNFAHRLRPCSQSFGAALYGLIALQPLFLQTLIGYTALDAGMDRQPARPRGAGGNDSSCASLSSKEPGQNSFAAFGFAMFGVSALLLSRLTLQVSMRNIVAPERAQRLLARFHIRPAHDRDAARCAMTR